ncbi:MAG TPA: hypothetical protein VKT78_18075 [Fimbriimonadaceae bacterium]|nr:hypothetical protein [Fimbriimonadaceae bacterium]
MKNAAAKAAGIVALACGSVSPALCQSNGTARLSDAYQSHYLSVDLAARGGDRATWGTLALVSGIVLIFGLVDDDPTLTILGGVGLLFSLYESGQFGFRYGPQYGHDLVHTGPISFGVNPRGEVGLSNGALSTRPTAFVQWKIRL